MEIQKGEKENPPNHSHLSNATVNGLSASVLSPQVV